MPRRKAPPAAPEPNPPKKWRRWNWVLADKMWRDSGLSREQRLYLEALRVMGMPYRATRAVREQYKVVVTLGMLRKWREDPVFSDLYETVRREYWDAYAAEGEALIEKYAGKLSGGASNLRIQQLNRAIPDEYQQTIVQQIHQNVTYQADGEFKAPEAPTRQMDKNKPSTVN